MVWQFQENTSQKQMVHHSFVTKYTLTQGVIIVDDYDDTHPHHCNHTHDQN